MRTVLVLIAIVGLLTAHTNAAPSQVTFNRHIAPIIYRNCSACHRPGEAAPFPLLSYEDVQKKGKTIAKAVVSHAMPPWKAEPASFPYRDERRLTEQEIALIEPGSKKASPKGAGDET